MENLNNKPCYPFTYGDKDGENPKLSDFVVKVSKSKRFQRYMGSVSFALFAVLSRAQPVPAIPPEYGEAAANIAEAAGQAVPPLGDIAGTAQGAAQGAAQGVCGAQGAIQGGYGAQGAIQGGYGAQGAVHGAYGGQGVGNPGRVELPGGAGGHGPQKPPANIWKLPGPPMSPTGQYSNTLLIIGSVGWICLNASWGNPILAYGCIGIVGGVLNELRKHL